MVRSSGFVKCINKPYENNHNVRVAVCDGRRGGGGRGGCARRSRQRQRGERGRGDGEEARPPHAARVRRAPRGAGSETAMAKKGKAKKRAAAEAVLGDAHGGAVRRGGGSGSGGAKRARPARPAWETLNWASVGGTEKVIHGAEDGAGGFMSLEVIDASEVDGFLALSGVGNAQAAASSGDVREKAVKTKKGGKAKATAVAAPPALADAAAPTERADAAERGAGTLAQRGQQKKKKKLRGPRNKKKAAALKQAKEAQRAAAKGAEAGDVAGTDTGAVERSDVLPASGASSLAGTAWAAFGLHPLLERGLADLGFTSPTPIQSECVPSAARGRSDIVGAAETGSGKTLAFGLPVLHRLLEERDALEADGLEPDARLRALIICPTRELALQVKDHMASVAKHVGKGLRVVPIVGGMAQQKQERLLRARPAVVVATPGRLWELMSNGDAHLSDLSGLRFFVLDEADRMVRPWLRVDVASCRCRCAERAARAHTDCASAYADPRVRSCWCWRRSSTATSPSWRAS